MTLSAEQLVELSKDFDLTIDLVVYDKLASLLTITGTLPVPKVKNGLIDFLTFKIVCKIHID